MMLCKQGRQPIEMDVRVWNVVIVTVFLCFSSCWREAYGQGSQYFVERPSDHSVIRGSTAVLKCVVGNRKGAVQWAKDGFPLGFNHSIPGLSRYSMVSNFDGEFNLMIVATRLTDDATYACQVLPGEGDSRLQAKATLTVKVPCEAPQIVNYNNNSVVEVPHTQDSLSLTCKSRLGRPAATIEWYRDGVKITAGISNSIEPFPSDKRETAISTITIPLGNHNGENGRTYQCRAWNSAVLGPAMRTSVTLSIMFPPSAPEISGYTSGRVIKANDTLLLTCISRGGNPLATVTWFRNTVPVDRSFSSRQNQSTNEFAVQVKPADNHAILRCEVTNLVTLQPLTAQYNLTVHFPPTSVVMSGASQPVKAGRQVTLTCVTSISNPKASVTWFAKNSPVSRSKITETHAASAEGGYITTSRVRVRVGHQDHKTVYTCQATTPGFGQTVADTHTLNVLYPPNTPEISGYNEGNTVRAGHLERMTCIAVGGNPVATLKWYKGNKLIRDVSYKAIGNIASSEIAIVLEADDNGATYKCKASNLATPTPLQTSIRLAVHFPPSLVLITQSTTEPKAGDPMDLTCVCSSSNPPAEITWIKNGRRMLGVDLGSVNSENGGKNTTSRLRIIPTSKDHKAVYGCRATNRALDQSQTDAVTLDVKFKPEFDEDLLPDKVESTQGERTVVNLTAYANPPASSYTLLKDGTGTSIPSRFSLSTKGILTISRGNKGDSGMYTVKAVNSEGFATYNFSIDVKYSATIVKITSRQVKNEGETAIFACKVEANPMVPNIVTWSRSDGFDMTRTSTRVDGATTYLSVPGLTKEDGGTFKCAADNRIGSVATRTTKLVVKFVPIIDKSTEISRSAGEKGSTITLLCKAMGAPDVTLSWTRNNQAITASSKYIINNKKNNIKYESTLKIKNLTRSDYGPYVCTATNTKGSDSHSITVTKTSKPFPPKSITFLNSTSSSISISWRPGFNGGKEQSFRVRYKPTDARGFMYVDVRPFGTTFYKISGLELDTQYEITVLAFNEKGESPYLAKGIVAKTSDLVTPSDIATSELQGSDELPVIIILVVCIVGVFILTLNIGLILFFIRRRKKRLENGTSDTTSHTNTFELYGNSHKGDNSFYPPPSDDARSYGTYDKSMDDFSDDYMQNGDKSEQFKNYSVVITEFEDLVIARKLQNPSTEKPGFDAQECETHVFLPRPQKDYIPNSRPYSPPHKIMESPRLGHKQTFFTDDNISIGRNSPWNEETAYKVAIPPKYRRENGSINGDIYDYKSNKHVGMNELSDRPSSRPSSRTGKTPPPPPPLRSSSKGSSDYKPPLPSRNYSPHEVTSTSIPPPRYVPIPGSSSVLSPNIVANPNYNGPQMARTPSPNDTLPVGSEFRGHLV